VLPKVAEQLAAHGEPYLDDGIREQLGRISRSTLARRVSTFPRVRVTRIVARARIRSEVPTDRHDDTESRIGALEIDLVEHNGGDSSGHCAYTLDVVDVMSGCEALSLVHFLLAPMAVGVLVLREPLVRIVYERGVFDAAATQQTASALLFPSLGVAIFTMPDLVSRAFFTMQDTTT
jgi:hypothetical protein